jgi:hypothetical protein
MTERKFLALPLAMALALAVIAMTSFMPMANAQTSPRVQIQLGTTGLTSPLVANSDDAVVARLSLNTTGSSEPVRITSLPFILSTGSGALASSLENCRVYNEASASANLSTPSDPDNTLVSGLNNIALTNALVLPANTVTVLGLRCDVESNLVTGGTYTFSMNTANVVATGANTGLPAAVTVPGGTVVIPPVVVTPTPTTPGLPTTGFGGESAGNYLVMLGSVLAMTFGLAYILKNSKRA